MIKSILLFVILFTVSAMGQSPAVYNKFNKLKANELLVSSLETQVSSVPCPLMTEAQMLAVVSPKEGSCVFNLDTDLVNTWDGSTWSVNPVTNNILKNPSFEHSIASTGWSGSTIISETIQVVHGNKSAKIVLNNQILNLNQNSTLYASQFADGVQGLLTVRIKNTAPGIRFCPTQAGAIVSALCVSVSTNGKWGVYKRPVTLGGTSNGISIDSNGVPVSGTLIVDDSKLGAEDVKQEVTGCNDVKCQTEFSAKISSAGVVSSENLDWISGNASIASTSFYTITFNTGVFSLTPNCLVTPSNSSSFESRLSAESATSLTSQFFINNGVPTATSFNITCQKQGIDFTNAKALVSGSVYSAPSDSFSTDSNVLIHKTTAITASDAVGTYNTFSYAANSNNITICSSAPSVLPTSADGFKIFTRAYNVVATCGNPARVEIKIAEAGTKLPTISIDLYKSAGKLVSGNLDHFYDGVSAFGSFVKDYNEKTGLLIFDAGFTGAQITNHLFLFSDFNALNTGYLVINAQKAKDSIVGSFTGMVTSQGSTSPDIQSVYFGSGANCTTPCTGTCTICRQTGTKITSVTFVSTGSFNVNGIDGTKYSCTGSGYNGGYMPIFQDLASSSSTFARVAMGVGGSPANASYASVTCLGNP